VIYPAIRFRSFFELTVTNFLTSYLFCWKSSEKRSGYVDTNLRAVLLTNPILTLPILWPPHYSKAISFL